ncbi:alkanesulfonate monooxygenase SsuD/methylene tetrahydromethanopterin reductase-like flavin-dependent oxidoreductase (luciferase family) [Actinocorallia herbida]|uniref:Alkanesulfonate monooxygenase SsuD/methylene tetrahydromethanopterin reductase-like flavin-dependent oxidoreductase (Luciferase family) n=1 Tax=Actinocorallia herbida TaxID=58109 RepID=A0A3N1CTZ8_9ACTN|nr:LLM class flavin-dependent oxidoreductase [Actinocorallia herbida]ROO84781.1 alkanesulfonate monooxygenase SsuD/methylene tetrahydromethanopterin reductase-like flavin-dependent oxidoreductase (luciferase family) [Actinocorallia herbida]
MTHLHLAVALDGAGWHPGAWRDPLARPAELFGARYWADLAAEAERGFLDFLTFEDALAVQSSRWEGPDGRTDQVRGRLDAVLVAARLAAVTSAIGLVPTTSTTHTEPFHVAIGIASLDHATSGRAGWRPQVSGKAADALHFGRRTLPVFAPEEYGTGAVAEVVAGLFGEAADAVEAVRRLWDSWEDDAIIRDTDTGRYVDRAKLHYIDFEGRHFSVRGPSITPRPPQGQPLITALAHDVVPYEFAARSADVVYVTPHSVADAHTIVGAVREAERTVGRTGAPLRVFADLVVFLGPAAADRKDALDELDGAPYTSDALVFTGTADDLADLLSSWQETGIEGFRLRPGALPRDLHHITRDLVPALQARGAFRGAYAEDVLRTRLGLARPANRYAPAP